MNRKIFGVVAILIMSVSIISACTQSYSQAPAATPTLIPTGLFVSPFPSVENPMAMIEEFAKGTATAAALTAAAGGGTTLTPGTPGTASANLTQITPQNITATNTPSTPGTPTNAIATTPVIVATTVTPGGPTLTPVVAAGNVYYLQKDEFPYCIARRFDKDPTALLAASGLTSPDIYYEGQKLVIPSGGSWPASAGPRWLRDHTSTYTVTGNDDNTVYGVACKFGPLDPVAIAQANGISVSASLSTGQQIKIP